MHAGVVRKNDLYGSKDSKGLGGRKGPPPNQIEIEQPGGPGRWKVSLPYYTLVAFYFFAMVFYEVSLRLK
jgi:hypothetical protein